MYYMTKKIKSFRLSHEALAILDRQENKSQFVDKAIRKFRDSPPWADLSYQLEEIRRALE